MEIKANAKISPIPDVLQQQQEEFKKNPEAFAKTYKGHDTSKKAKAYKGQDTSKKAKAFGGKKPKKKVSWYINHDTVLTGDRKIADRGKDDGARISLTMNPTGGTINDKGQVVNEKLKYDTIVRDNSGEAAWMGVQEHPQGADGTISGAVEYNQGQEVAVNFQLDSLKNRHAKAINAQLKAKYEALLKENGGNVNVPAFTATLNAERQQAIQGLSATPRYQQRIKQALATPISIQLVPKGNHSQTLMPQSYKAIGDNTVMYGRIVIPANDDRLKEIKRKNTTTGSQVNIQNTHSTTKTQQVSRNFKQFEKNRQAFIEELVDAVSNEFSSKLTNSFKINDGGKFINGNKSSQREGTDNSVKKTDGTVKRILDNKTVTKDRGNTKKIGGGISKEASKDGSSGGGSGILGKLINKLGPWGKGLKFVLNLGNMFKGMGFSGNGELTFNGGKVTTKNSGQNDDIIKSTETTNGTSSEDVNEDYFSLETNFFVENQESVNITEAFKQQITQKFRSELAKEIGVEMTQYIMQRTSTTDTNSIKAGSKKDTTNLGGTEYQHTVREKGKPYLEITGRKEF